MFAGNCFASSYLGDVGEVVVRGQRQSAGSLVTELKKEDIEKTGISNAAEALDLLAGADAQTAGKGEVNVSLRGFEQRNLKILIDGVPAYEGYLGTVDLSAIPAESIEKIIVTKGAASVLYGANTMGGVVNIITTKEREGTYFSSSFGGYNAKNFVLSRGAQAGKFNYYLGGSRRSSDGWRLSGDFDKNDEYVGESSEYREDGGIRELSDYEKKTFVANIGFKPDSRTRLNLSLNYFDQERGCQVSSNRYWRFSEWNQSQLNLTAEKNINQALTLKTRLFYVDHNNEITDDAALTLAAGGKSWFDKSKYDDFSAGWELNSVLHWGGVNLLRVGANYQKDRNEQKEYNAKNKFGVIVSTGWGAEDEYEVDTLCFGIENSAVFGEKFSAVLGAGINYFKPVKSADYEMPEAITTMNPQVGINYNVGAGTLFFASAGKKTRFPVMKELYSAHAGGNPNIGKQTTIATEAGMEKTISSCFYFSASFFRNQISDLIEIVNKKYVNIAEVEMRGFEAEAKATLSNKFNMIANYTYLYAKEKRDENGLRVDIKLARRPSHKINIVPQYKPGPSSSITLPMTFTGRQKVYFPSERYTSSYFLIGAKVLYRLPVSQNISPEIFVSAVNITDADYEEGAGPMQGRNFHAGLNLRF